MIDSLWWIRPQETKTRAQRIRVALVYFWKEHCVPVLLLTVAIVVLRLWAEFVLLPWLREL